jgi:hypothetical protein
MLAKVSLATNILIGFADGNLEMDISLFHTDRGEEQSAYI